MKLKLNYAIFLLFVQFPSGRFTNVGSAASANITAYGYHVKEGILRAGALKIAEEKVANRIVGGTETKLSEYAFQAGILITLTSGWTSVCGGSLISRNKVLTAAHCWWDGVNQARTFTVVLGSVTLYSGGTRVETTAVTVHPTWNPSDVTFDVALADVDWVEYNNNIYPITLPSVSDANENFSGRVAIASGYGKLSDAVHLIPSTATLHHVELSIITNVECQKHFKFPLHGSHLCTRGSDVRGTCDGDSGGPLSLLWNNERILVGVASFGLASGCEQGHPSVFSRVTVVLPWILANL